MHIKKIEKNIDLFLASLILLLMTVAIFALYDIFKDFQNGTHLLHVGLEFFTFLFLSISIVLLLWSYKKINKKLLKTLRVDFSNLNSVNSNLKKGVSEKIHSQFMAWKLTKAESEVALLLIKGFSLKEISNYRKTSITTIKEQASSIYAKTKLKNRTELASFFFDDFLKIL